MLQNTTGDSSNRQFYSLIAICVLVYSTLSILAGMPATANLNAFIMGLIVLFLVVLAIFSITWYLLIKPLPAGLKASPISPIHPTLRQAFGIWFIFTGFLGVLGGVWDVAWHVSYGLPFGEDLFWRPHQFIYVALLSPIVIAAYIAFETMRKGKGTLQQRFRADMPLSLIMMGGILMAFALPADPLWHYLYAEDLTGLSIPHTIFTVVNVLLGVGFLSVLQSYQAARDNWEAAWKMSLLDATVLCFAAFTLIGLSFSMLGDYEVVNSPNSALSNLPALVSARPIWALPFMLVFAVTWTGTTASYALKRYGMASFVVLFAMLFRQSLNLVFANHPEDFSIWLFALPIALSIDLSLWYSAKEGKTLPIWAQAIFVSLIAGIATIPQISFAYSIPNITLADVPMILLAMALAAFAGIYIAKVVGSFIHAVKRQENLERQRSFTPQLMRTVTIASLLALAVAAWFILTALPPIA